MLSEMGVGAAHRTGWDVVSMLRVSGADLGSFVLTNVAFGAGIGVGCASVGVGTAHPDGFHVRTSSKTKLFALFVWACLTYKPWLKVLLNGLV